MTDSALMGTQESGAEARAAAPAFVVTATSRIEDVEATWSEITANTPIESPSQSYAFTRLWAETLGTVERDRVFITASLDGRALALLPLVRRRIAGIRVATWFPGTHVGCNAPIADLARLNALSSSERAALWHRMARAAGADLLYLPAMQDVPQFAELGASIAGDTLYRAEFSGWEDADKTQRSKSRRKHDRQQGEKLDALGDVAFEELDGGPERAKVLDTMFRQRAARFVEMGVADPFADPKVRAFYGATIDPASDVRVKLHVLRLDGAVVAVRYNILGGNRMFCLISSMSAEPRVQPGSPGKQCLLRVMQTIFDAGYASFDMGAGFTDEKRHWCNVQVPLRQHYVPVTASGHAAAAAHKLAQNARREIKTNPKLLAFAKKARGLLNRKVPAPSESAE